MRGGICRGRHWANTLALLAWLAAGSVAGVVCGGDDLRSLWRVDGRHEFPSAAGARSGFSLFYDGKPVGPALTADWRSETAAGGEQTLFRHASGLTVIRQVRPLPEFAAVECSLRLRNDGPAELPPLAAVRSMDLSFAGDLIDGLSVIRCGGGGGDAKYPPRDFAVRRTVLDSASNTVTLGGEGGSPSRTCLPLFFIHSDTRHVGIFVGVGWTGQWQATIRSDYAQKVLRVHAGLEGLDLRLRPGEEIAGPSVLIGCYRGTLADGTNALRRLVRQRYAPTVAGRPLVAPVLYTTWFNIGSELDEKLACTLIDRAAEMGQEVFLFDAGWYKGTPSRSYSDMRATWDAISHSLGNWEQGEDTDRFPSGLRALADRVRAKGMQFGLWFEPERCGPQSQLAREHPDWVSYIPGRKWGLVDLGNQAAQDYFCKTFDRYITEYGIRYIRWDMNHDLDFLLRYWATRDAPGRVGMAQIRHVEGLHRIEEYLRRRHPEVILESCAGGGNRIDLSTLALRHTIWVSDMGTDPHIVRFHLEGLNQFIPGAGQVIGVPLAPQLVRQPGFVLPDMTCQVCFAGAMGLYGRLHEWPPAVRETVRRHVDVYKTLRRFLAEDFYLLTTQARTLETWTGWQFHDAKTQQGFVQAFRLGAAESGVPLALHGLDPAAEYQFTDPYTGGGFEMSGAAALRPGLKFDLPPMSSRVLRYSRKP